MDVRVLLGVREAVGIVEVVALVFGICSSISWSSSKSIKSSFAVLHYIYDRNQSFHIELSDPCTSKAVT